MRTIMCNGNKGSNMILNVDDSSLGNPDVLGFDGLIQNADGVWTHNFMANVSYSNIIHDELMTLYHGFRMVWDLIIHDELMTLHQRSNVLFRLQL